MFHIVQVFVTRSTLIKNGSSVNKDGESDQKLCTAIKELEPGSLRGICTKTNTAATRTTTTTPTENIDLKSLGEHDAFFLKLSTCFFFRLLR